MKKNIRFSAPTLQDVREVLSYLPSRPAYFEWIRIVSAIGNTFPEEVAIALLLSRFRDEKVKEHQYYLQHRLHHIGYGTLVTIAKSHGYQKKRPHSYSASRRNYAAPDPIIAVRPSFSFPQTGSGCVYRFRYMAAEERAAFYQYEAGLERSDADALIMKTFPHMESERLYRIATNTKAYNKERDYEKLNFSYYNQLMSADELISLILSGGSFVCSQLATRTQQEVRPNGYCIRSGTAIRKNEAWQGADLFAIDIDKGSTIEECLCMEQTRYALFLYTTCSHSKEQHRFRLVFALPYFETDEERYRAIVRHYATIYNADTHATDPCRNFYGNTNALVYSIWRKRP